MSLPIEVMKRARLAAQNPGLREHAAWILDVCQDACSYACAGSRYVVMFIESVEGPTQATALAEAAFSAVFVEMATGNGFMWVEAAGLLRDGWSPGDRVRRKR